MELPTTYVEGFHEECDLRKMVYIRGTGSTELCLSQLGIGGGSLGNHYGKINEDDGISLVRQGIKRGINYIDTSPYYGHTSSEILIGKALKEIPREAYYISTKVGRYGTSWADFFDFSAERIISEFEKSLERLGLESVDILFVYDIEFGPWKQILTEALPAAQSLVDKGKAKYLGVSGYPVSLLWEAVEKSPVKIDVVLSYARDCLFDSTLKKYASFFQAHDVRLINASLTGMGLLTNQGPPEWHPATDKLKTICRDAGQYCKDKGVELGNLSVYHSMHQPGYSSYLVGMKTLEELESNLKITTEGLSQQECSVLDEVRQKFFNSADNHHWEGVELEQYRKYQQANEAKT
ncbi:uncharacterized protein LOC128992079 [Macrosteles quadrilineatus]|uniref:uncharacterized protein LOC128992079 n=1 Tax=Macrosteles quadrilineatus TaxID=74068 RepID=UPI0023E0C7E3|nr:uncharacterized protein LOC128992079 [Macrosteles quadrilineatus]